MARFAAVWFKNAVCPRFFLSFLALTTILTGFVSAEENQSKPPQVCEGSLLYRSPISGRYEVVPLLHTDVQFDVRGSVAAATVTQRADSAGAADVAAAAARVAAAAHAPEGVRARPGSVFA